MLAAEEPCHTYSSEEVFNYNFHLWATIFVVFGINFSHMDVGPMQHFTLDPKVMKTWGPGLWTIFATLLVTVGCLLHNTYKVLKQSNCLVAYLIAGAVVVGGMWLYTKRVSS